MPTWWGTRQNVSPLLRREVDVMRVTFGDTFKLVVPQWAPLYWLGTIEINMRGIPQREHVLKLLYPNEFPDRPPEAYVQQPKIYSEKHQFEDGQLCLFNPKDGASYGWNPSGSTVVTVTGWAIEWLYAYYTWRATNHWPGQEEHIHR
ncbi:MAG: hypothetical protein ABI947_13520 [Chloroflexota bacterium]